MCPHRVCSPVRGQGAALRVNGDLRSCIRTVSVPLPPPPSDANQGNRTGNLSCSQRPRGPPNWWRHRPPCGRRPLLTAGLGRARDTPRAQPAGPAEVPVPARRAWLGRAGYQPCEGILAFLVCRGYETSIHSTVVVFINPLSIETDIDLLSHLLMPLWFPSCVCPAWSLNPPPRPIGMMLYEPS